MKYLMNSTPILKMQPVQRVAEKNNKTSKIQYPGVANSIHPTWQW
jgi:hypothetical protein